MEKLLDDISEFKDKTDGSDYYCIQPLVLLKKDNEYEVIDGQQRLTTLYLILLYISKTVYKNDSSLYTILYDSAGRTESETFLKKLTVEKAQDDIDFNHIFNAYLKISEWFEKEEPNKLLLNNFASAILNIILNQLRFIWYKVDKTDGTPIDIFHRLNAGKIKLTDSELIKALLLSEDSIKKSLKIQQSLGSDFLKNLSYLDDCKPLTIKNCEILPVGKGWRVVRKPNAKKYLEQFHELNKSLEKGVLVASADTDRVEMCCKLIKEIFNWKD